jgi:hypothetical protein
MEHGDGPLACFGEGPRKQDSQNGKEMRNWY